MENAGALGRKVKRETIQGGRAEKDAKRMRERKRERKR